MATVAYTRQKADSTGNVVQVDAGSRTNRMAFVDNVRIFLTILVVAHHAGQAYGPTGGEWPIFDAQQAPILGAFFGANAAFFMGLFFLIAGYFTPAAYDHNCAAGFLKSRFMRLGVPLVLVSLFLFGPVAYMASEQQLSFWDYFFRVYVGQLQYEVGRLWFVFHLLVYAIAYALWRQLGRLFRVGERPIAPPSHRTLLLYTLALAGITFLVRIEYPIDRWVELLGVIPAEIAHLPQYLSLFIIGIVAYRNNWLRTMPTGSGMIWLGIGLASVGLRYAYSGGLNTVIPVPLLASGGAHLAALIWSVWEAFICVGMCVGLPALFRERLNSQGRWLRVLSANAYTVYLIHIFVVVGLQMSIAGIAFPPLVKFALVTVVGMALSFVLSQVIRSAASGLAQEWRRVVHCSKVQGDEL
jgi:fucose 4-O-acetylase-like acetyltransferase